MSDTLANLEAFIQRWRAPLKAGAQLTFETRALDKISGTPSSLADSFVGSLGYTPIGANWEMLDPGSDADAPRSAIATMADALTMDMALPQQQWLGEKRATQCAQDFIECFDLFQRTILTNRMYFGWNPISEAKIEWAFVGYDQSAIALLLLTREG